MINSFYAKPGELVDLKGVPIYPGDLLKTFHFTGLRGKRYWLYHVVTLKNSLLFMTPTSWLEPTSKRDGGECMLSVNTVDGVVQSEVIHCGPGEHFYFDDRPKGPQ